MSFTKKTVQDTKIRGKQVLMRADFNVPLKDGKITDDFRIKQSLPTIEYLLEQDCAVVICSHLGRPKGINDKTVSLKPIAKHLAKLLGKNVKFAEDCIGDDAFEQSKQLKSGEILLLENLRYYKEEKANDHAFAKKLSGFGQVFVQDGFGVVHRAHASTDAITQFLPSVAGLLLEREVTAIIDVMENPKRPLVAIIGGAKISDKISVLNRFVDIADVVAVGGAMANTFLLAEGIDVGDSLVEPEEVDLAKIIIEKAKKRTKSNNFVFYLPQDGVVATSLDKNAKTRIVDWDAHVIADVQNYPKRPPTASMQIDKNEKILDIGPFSGAFIAGTIQLAQSVIWNGTMGVTETPSLNGPIGPFAHGTDLIVDAMTGQYGHTPFTVAGGGDTVGYIHNHNLTDMFNHVSTGGGASMELMSGKTLPGVEALQDKTKKVIE